MVGPAGMGGGIIIFGLLILFGAVLAALGLILRFTTTNAGIKRSVGKLFVWVGSACLLIAGLVLSDLSLLPIYIAVFCAFIWFSFTRKLGRATPKVQRPVVEKSTVQANEGVVSTAPHSLPSMRWLLFFIFLLMIGITCISDLSSILTYETMADLKGEDLTRLLILFPLYLLPYLILFGLILCSHSLISAIARRKVKPVRPRRID